MILGMDFLRRLRKITFDSNCDRRFGEESSDQVDWEVRASRRMRRRPRHLSPDPQQKQYQEVEYEAETWTMIDKLSG